MWRELGIPCVYTLEASFCGADRGEIKDQHFQVEHLQNCGEKLLMALLIYCKIDVDKKIAEMKKKPEEPVTEPKLPKA